MNRDCGKVTPAPALFPRIAPKLGSHRCPFVGSQSARQERCQNGIEWGGQARQLKMPLLPLLPPKPHPTTFTVPALQRRSRGTTRVVTASLQPGSGVVGHPGPYLEIGGGTQVSTLQHLFSFGPHPRRWHSGTVARWHRLTVKHQAPDCLTAHHRRIPLSPSLRSSTAWSESSAPSAPHANTGQAVEPRESACKRRPRRPRQPADAVRDRWADTDLGRMTPPRDAP